MGTSQLRGLLGRAGVWQAPSFEMSLLTWLHERFLPGYYDPYFSICHTGTTGSFRERRGYGRLLCAWFFYPHSNAEMGRVITFAMRKVRLREVYLACPGLAGFKVTALYQTTEPPWVGE